MISLSDVISVAKILPHNLRNNIVDVLKFILRHHMIFSIIIFLYSIFILLCPKSIADLYHMSDMINTMTPFCFFTASFLLIFWITKPIGLKYLEKQKREEQENIQAEERKEQDIIKTTLINTSDDIKEKIHKAYSANKKYIEFENNDTFPSLDLTMLVNNGVLKNSSINIIKNTIEYALTDKAIPVVVKFF
jgi:hypothetical protein